MANPKRTTVINVPSDIGSMIKGKHLAPAAFQSVGFTKKLAAAGFDVNEVDALRDGPQIWSVEADFESNGVRNEQANVQVNHDVQKAVTDALESSTTSPFVTVVGGECSMVPAIMSALWTRLAPKRVGVLYIDADADLVLPDEPGSNGNVASMTMSHLIMREGALKSMQPFTRPNGEGVCDPGNTVLFGLNSAAQNNTRPQLGYLFDEGYRVFTSASVAKVAKDSAKKALEWLEERVDFILVHLDVDAIDGTRFPLANLPNRTGVEFDKIMAALEIFLASEKVCALSIAEVNPDHDPGLKMTTRLVDSLVCALRGRVEKRQPI